MPRGNHLNETQRVPAELRLTVVMRSRARESQLDGFGEALGGVVRARGEGKRHRRNVGTGPDDTPLAACYTPRSTTREGNSMLKEFRAFLLRGNLLELAVAFVIGAASFS